MPSTLRAILNDMNRFVTSKGEKRNPDDYADVVIRYLEVRVYERNKQITIQTQVDSVTTNGAHRYDTHLMFSNINLSEVKRKGDIPLEDNKTRKVYYAPPVNFDSSVQIKCTCTDFRHTWETELKRGNALIGFPRKYTRKTDYWPERNPRHVMGVCKHLFSVIREIGTIGVLRP